MVTSAVQTTRRYLNILRRALEISAVLGACFILTVLNLCFGWVALFFNSSPRDHSSSQAISLSPAKATKEY